MRIAAFLVLMALAVFPAEASDVWLGSGTTVTSSGTSAVNASALPSGVELTMQCRVGDTAALADVWYKACATSSCTATVDSFFLPSAAVFLKLSVEEHYVAILSSTAGTIKCRFYKSAPALLGR